MKNGLLLPLASRLSADEAVVAERERVELLRVLQDSTKNWTLAQVHSGVNNMRNALGASLPGQVSVADAIAFSVTCAATMCGIFMDAMRASAAQSEGHAAAVADAFEHILKDRQRMAGRERRAEKQ